MRYCTICRHDDAAAMVEAWGMGESLRKIASRYNVGYRSVQRHLDLCLASIMSEYEEKRFQHALWATAAYVRHTILAARRKKRPRSIIKTPVPWTWSRRSWKGKREEK